MCMIEYKNLDCNRSLKV